MSMTITRNRGETRRSEALADRIAGMSSPCVGCSDCRGLCKELIEVLVVPEIILNETREHV